ncbi:MAG: hypothetical protein Q4G34_09045 [Micrococcus sp.]|nr:hypothetical protein [Micrococcus sp.]
MSRPPQPRAARRVREAVHRVVAIAVSAQATLRQTLRDDPVAARAAAERHARHRHTEVMAALRATPPFQQTQQRETDAMAAPAAASAAQRAARRCLDRAVPGHAVAVVSKIHTRDVRAVPGGARVLRVAPGDATPSQLPPAHAVGALILNLDALRGTHVAALQDWVSWLRPEVPVVGFTDSGLCAGAAAADVAAGWRGVRLPGERSGHEHAVVVDFVPGLSLQGASVLEQFTRTSRQEKQGYRS